MAPAPGGGPGGASAGPGRKGTPPGPRLGPAGHGPQGSGDAGGAAGTGAAGPRGAGRWARRASPLPAAPAPIAHPAIPRPRLPRSPAREAGGAEPGAGPPCERPRAGLGLRAPLRLPGLAQAPSPNTPPQLQGSVGSAVHPPPRLLRCTTYPPKLHSVPSDGRSHPYPHTRRLNDRPGSPTKVLVQSPYQCPGVQGRPPEASAKPRGLAEPGGWRGRGQGRRGTMSAAWALAAAQLPILEVCPCGCWRRLTRCLLTAACLPPCPNHAGPAGTGYRSTGRQLSGLQGSGSRALTAA